MRGCRAARNHGETQSLSLCRQRRPGLRQEGHPAKNLCQITMRIITDDPLWRPRTGAAERLTTTTSFSFQVFVRLLCGCFFFFASSILSTSITNQAVLEFPRNNFHISNFLSPIFSYEHKIDLCFCSTGPKCCLFLILEPTVHDNQIRLHAKF